MTDIERLVAFITAQLDAEEADAKRAGGDRWQEGGYWWLEGVQHAVVGPGEVAFTHDGYRPHIVRQDPANVLRSVAAKRRIVAQCAEHIAAGPALEPITDNAWDVLLALAEPHSDHPDYDPTWSPA